MRKNKIVRRALHLSSRSSIKMFLRQNLMIVASLLASTQEFSLEILRNVLNYARNIDAIMSFATLSRMANVNNNHVYDSIASFDQANNSLFEIKNLESLLVVQKFGALYVAPCNRCEIRHYMRCVAFTRQAYDIARPH